MSLDRDLIVQNLFGEIRALKRRIERLEAAFPGPPGTGPGNVPYMDDDGAVDLSQAIPRLPFSTYDISNPPTEAQIAAAIGDASAWGAGAVATCDDNGLGNLMRMFLSNGTEWFYSPAFTDAG
jgi:hypothetical protein